MEEYITRGDNVMILTEEDEIVTTKRMVGNVAATLYADFRKYKKSGDVEEKKRLKKEMLFQSQILDSLSRACRATN